MESYLGLLWLLIITLSIIHIVQAQDQQGFISLDCGLPANEQSPYKETSTRLQFSSDVKFIHSGKTGIIQANLVSRNRKPYTTLRHFPDGIRNCYNLNVDKGRRYLIRAVFVYGNYDDLDIKPVFDLYLGPNLWATIDLVTQVNGTREDIIHVTTSNSLQICLVKTRESTPLISALELRPMGNDSYNSLSGSLKLYSSNYLSDSGPGLRYRDDVNDRIWDPLFKNEWTKVSTALDVNNINKYDPPKDALKNAAMPTNAGAPLIIQWSSANPDDEYHLYAHFAEIQDLQANETREFNLSWNGAHFYGPFIPTKLRITTIFNRSPNTCDRGGCRVHLIRTNVSTLPPLLNAYEIYRVIQFPQSETDESDVGAINNIATTYSLSRINWQGDPCVPQQLGWDGLNCSNTNMSMPPRITTLNLSSSGLTGTIAAAIQNLTQLEKLDLSNNKLTGRIPEFLGNMTSLLVINLSGNNLDGSIPQALQREGLELSIAGNPRLCLSDSCQKLPKKVYVPIVASVASAAIVIVLLILILLLKKKRSTILQGIQLIFRAPSVDVKFANKKTRRFTYSEVIKMTNNYERVLGEGGFGMVYHGTNGLEQVAVKVLSQSSTQGFKEFKAEVELLLRVHHTNLVRLVGYCDEGDHLALIYELLPNGDLKQHLSGNGGTSIINWSIRLQIALEAALGLEYLHNGCTPSMVHRDVKTANILLDKNLKAKLADFGLSRSFQIAGSGESLDLPSYEGSRNPGFSPAGQTIAGTPGYLDPECFHTSRLTEKSDIYSFGVVLLEMITNQPVINHNTEKSHITQWVGFKVNRGDIIEIMDPNLGMDYDINSVWRALELAMSCADPSSSKRPSMSQVINELKECIVCENLRISKNPGLESQEMNIRPDTPMAPIAR